MQAKVKEGKNILYIIRIILAFLVLIECTFLKVFSHYGVSSHSGKKLELHKVVNQIII